MTNLEKQMISVSYDTTTSGITSNACYVNITIQKDSAGHNVAIADDVCWNDFLKNSCRDETQQRVVIENINKHFYEMFDHCEKCTNFRYLIPKHPEDCCQGGMFLDEWINTRKDYYIEGIDCAKRQGTLYPDKKVIETIFDYAIAWVRKTYPSACTPS